MLATPDTIVQPAHLWIPPHVSTAGVEAADLAESAGLILEPEQRLALDALLAERADGRWAALEACIICPRRNGKTWALIAAVLADLFLFGADTVVWSAHEFKTAMEAFRDIKKLIEGAPHLMRRIKNGRFNESNGDEGFELHNGGRMMFKARTKSGGRGLGGDRVVLDEAFALTSAMVGSLMPLLGDKSMTGNPQLVYASSAGKADADVLRRVRDRGRAGNDPSLAYVEWCAPVTDCADSRCDHQQATPGCALDNVDLWHQANPGINRRISMEYLHGERRAMTPDEFVRERLGWWEEPSGSVAGLPMNLWTAAASLTPPGTLLAFAADVTPDLAYASIARATTIPNGVLLDLPAHRRGTSWVADEMARLRGESTVPVALDLGSPASVLADDFARAGIETVNPAARDVVQGCSSLLDGLIRMSVWHSTDADLDAAVKGATRRPVGDAWAWSRKNSLVDISPLVASTLALWGAGQVPDTGGGWMVGVS